MVRGTGVLLLDVSLKDVSRDKAPRPPPSCDPTAANCWACCRQEQSPEACDRFCTPARTPARTPTGATQGVGVPHG